MPTILDLSKNVNLNSSANQKTIIEAVEFLNDHHKVLNVDKFGPLNADSVSVVLAVQVHNRPEYLSFLIESLANTQGINQTVVVFSHDMNVPEINDMIANITFCWVIQIFYPHNIQLFHNVFPGPDKNDCGEINCQNYQKAQLAQIKNHWYWKMNYVMDGIVKRYGLNDKYILRLEEDHFMVPDALYILDLMIKNKNTICDECEILCLGSYLKSHKPLASHVDEFNTQLWHTNDINKLKIQFWYASQHNMGFALTLKTWEKIRNCSQLFCTFDDYNWDWTLLQISVRCMNPRMKVIVAKAPRVFHIGDRGVHTNSNHNTIANARELVKANAQNFFPATIVKSETLRGTYKPPKPNGGWSDLRDHELCKMNTFPYKSKNQNSK